MLHASKLLIEAWATNIYTPEYHPPATSHKLTSNSVDSSSWHLVGGSSNSAAPADRPRLGRPIADETVGTKLLFPLAECGGTCRQGEQRNNVWHVAKDGIATHARFWA